MNVVIRVVNTNSESVKIGLDGGVEIKAGTHEYTLKKAIADQVVKAASVLKEIEVQLIPQANEDSPSTVDGKAELIAANAELKENLAAASEELETVSAELATAKAELETVSAELEKSKAAQAGGDKNEGATTTKKSTGKRTTTKTENKE